MSPAPPGPLPLCPVGVRRRWAGDRIHAVADLSVAQLSEVGDVDPSGEGYGCGEWWLLSCREGARSLIAEGPDRGRSLAEVLAERPREILGVRAETYGSRFPLLLKIIDTGEPLSVQVHPDHRQAPGEGKTESWYFLSALPEARYYLGLRPGVDPRQLIDATAGGRDPIPDLRSHGAQPGTLAHVPPGTIHALGGGLLLLEIQENSGTTYRIYDWNRPGTELHREAARAAVRQTQDAEIHDPIDPGALEQTLVSCSAYGVQRLQVAQPTPRSSREETFTVLIALGDGVQLRHSSGTWLLRRGNAVLLPAAMGAYEIHPSVPTTVLQVQPGGERAPGRIA